MKRTTLAADILAVLPVSCPKHEAWTDDLNEGLGVLVCQIGTCQEAAPNTGAFLCDVTISALTFVRVDQDRSRLRKIFTEALAGVYTLQKITPVDFIFDGNADEHTFDIKFKIAIQE